MNSGSAHAVAMSNAIALENSSILSSATFASAMLRCLSFQPNQAASQELLSLAQICQTVNNFDGAWLNVAIIVLRRTAFKASGPSE